MKYLSIPYGNNLLSYCLLVLHESEDLINYTMQSNTTHFIQKSKNLNKLNFPDNTNFAGLVFVDLTNNHLSSIAPISMCTNLTLLRLNKNAFDTFPTEVAQLTQLKIFDFSSNWIKTLPPALSSLTNLQEMSFIQNKVTTIPKELTTLTNIQRLYFSANSVKKLPKQLTSFSNLRVIDIGNNFLSHVPSCVFSYTNLSTLRLDFNSITSISPLYVNLTNLVLLSLQKNSLTSFPDVLCNVPSLTSLDISYNSFDTLPQSISNLSNLKHLFIDNNKLTSLPNEISLLTNLNTFSMASHHCTSLPNLSLFSKLTYLNLGNGNLVNIPTIGGNNCMLRIFNNNVTSVDLLKNVTIDLLDLSKNQLKECPTFSKLNKIFKLDISNNCISSITTQHINTSLLSLDISNNLLTNFPLALFECTHLITLNISSCHLITIPKGISSLINLEQLIAINNHIIQVNDAITSLTKLTLFYAQTNQLQQFPIHLLSIHSLRDISLANNSIQTIPSQITNLSNLRCIDLSCNDIKDMTPLCSMQSLITINMSYNLLTILSPKLTELKSLDSLNIIGNQIEKVPQNILNNKTISRFQLGKQGKKKRKEKVGITRSRSPFITAAVMDNDMNQFELPSQSSLFQQTDQDPPLVGIAEMQGRRVDMQDTVCVVQNFCGNLHLFCVFDGHGGMDTSRLCAQMLPTILSQKLTNSTASNSPLESIIKTTFSDLNTDVIKKQFIDGTAALIVLITPQAYCVANAGDSRALLVRQRTTEVLSHDHKPTELTEFKRIRNERGFVDQNGRLNGMVAISRSIGDIDCQPSLTCEPEILFFEKKATDCFLVLACDGIWDVLSNDEVCQIVRERSDFKPEQIACYIRDLAYARNTGDNISCIVVDLR
ncbi:Adenylate cyclase [Entamoeba marina]